MLALRRMLPLLDGGLVKIGRVLQETVVPSYIPMESTSFSAIFFFLRFIFQ